MASRVILPRNASYSMSIRWGFKVLLLIYPPSYTLVLLAWQVASLVASKVMVREDIDLEVVLMVGASFSGLHLMAKDRLRFSP